MRELDETTSALSSAPQEGGDPAPAPDGSAGSVREISALAQLRSRGRVRRVLPLLGPAFVAAIAYVDPGNFATNFTGGAAYGYQLLWVIVAANLMAMLIQSLSAKVGLATGRNLAELCREHYRAPVVWGLWGQAEAVAMATDLAEIIGGAIALNLLFGIPLFSGGVITGAVAFGLLALQGRSYRRFEIVIAGLLGVILLGFLYNLLRAGADAEGVARGLVPSFAGTDSILLATGILGATVMPHVIYLHSALTQKRIPACDAAERHTLLRHQRVDVALAMGVAGIVNMAMLVISARLFFEPTGRGDRHDRGGARRAQQVARPGRSVGFRAGTVGLGVRLLQRRDLRGANCDARLPTSPDLAAAATGTDDGARTGGAGRRRRPHSSSGVQPGRPVLWYPLRAGPPGPADPTPRGHGRARQPAGDHGGGCDHRSHHRGPERVPPLPDLAGLTLLPVPASTRAPNTIGVCRRAGCWGRTQSNYPPRLRSSHPGATSLHYRDGWPIFCA